MLACNHPNSFLDAIIVGSLFDRPVHFLARGDALPKSFWKILSLLKIIPVYKISEGRSDLLLGEATVRRCRNVLAAGGIVLIFSEGICMQQWALQPLGKGSARIALEAWNDDEIAGTFSVVPVSLNYDSFVSFGKKIILHIGEAITKSDLSSNRHHGEAIRYFNQLLSDRLEAGMLLSTAGNAHVIPLLINMQAGVASGNTMGKLKALQKDLEENHLSDSLSVLRRPCIVAGSRALTFNKCLAILLALPAIAGWALNAPLYSVTKKTIQRKTFGTVYFDSVLFSAFLVAYPLYWTGLMLAAGLLVHQATFTCVIAAMPFLAWITIRWKALVQSIANHRVLPPTARAIVDRALAKQA